MNLFIFPCLINSNSLYYIRIFHRKQTRSAEEDASQRRENSRLASAYLTFEEPGFWQYHHCQRHTPMQNSVHKPFHAARSPARCPLKFLRMQEKQNRILLTFYKKAISTNLITKGRVQSPSYFYGDLTRIIF